MHDIPNKVETNGKLNLPQADFTPNPQDFLMGLIDAHIGNVSLLIAHGSYIYRGAEGPLNRTYKETRTYNNGIFQRSDFETVIQPPDVDVLAIAPEPNVFKEELLAYCGKTGALNGLNHFLEMTIVSESVMREEINRPGSGTAMRRVFGLKQLVGFGDIDLMRNLQNEAKELLTPESIAFQTEFNRMKDLYRQNATADVGTFSLSREDFARDYPLILQFYDSADADSPFPKVRQKLTIPKPMKLREWRYYKDWELIDPSTIKMND